MKSKINKGKLVFRILIALFIIGAAIVAYQSFSDSTLAKWGGYGSEFKIELVNCDGTITHSWISTGKVQSESSSDGYYFKDKTTEKLVEVTGTLIITQHGN